MQKAGLLSHSGVRAYFRFILLNEFLRPSRQRWGQGCPRDKKGGQPSPITLIAIQKRPANSLLVWSKQFTVWVLWILMDTVSLTKMILIYNNFAEGQWPIGMVGHDSMLFGMVWYLDDIYRFKSQFCSWPLIARPPCVVSVCGWNGFEAPSNITPSSCNVAMLCNTCISMQYYIKFQHMYKEAIEHLML